MNYSYKIINDTYIQELYGNSIELTWNLKQFKKDINTTELFMKSFYRTKKWLIENYPELAL